MANFIPLCKRGESGFLFPAIICQAHLLADPLIIPLMYNLVLWNYFLKKKSGYFLTLTCKQFFFSVVYPMSTLTLYRADFLTPIQLSVSYRLVVCFFK